MASMPLRWDLFCRVVDNLGDVGVCWRLASELAARGHTVRLVIDDASALTWLAPHGTRGVTVVDWNEVARDDLVARAEPADVLIEAFGCTPPAATLNDVFAAVRPPVWINLEYLTAERYAEKSHGLASPQHDAANRRVDKWFFFPGFSARTGGLIREANLSLRRADFVRETWLAARGLSVGEHERVVSLFCYANDALGSLLDALAGGPPTVVLATAGLATNHIVDRLGPSLRRGALRAVALPPLAQTDYDHLLWASDVNVVRGEDSLVRAQWAGVPFLWQAYPQDDGAHVAKVDALLAGMNAEADVRALFHAWNGIGTQNLSIVWPDERRWRDAAAGWQHQLAAQPDLVTRLIAFVAGKR